MLIQRPTHYFAMPLDILWSPLLTLEEKGLLSFFYSMIDDFTEEDVTLLCGIPAERLEELVDSLMTKGFLYQDESGYKLCDSRAL